MLQYAVWHTFFLPTTYSTVTLYLHTPSLSSLLPFYLPSSPSCSPLTLRPSLPSLPSSHSSSSNPHLPHVSPPSLTLPHPPPSLTHPLPSCLPLPHPPSSLMSPPPSLTLTDRLFLSLQLVSRTGPSGAWPVCECVALFCVRQGGLGLWRGGDLLLAFLLLLSTFLHLGNLHQTV